MSAASRATSDPPWPMAMPICAFLRAGESLTPSPGAAGVGAGEEGEEGAAGGEWCSDGDVWGQVFIQNLHGMAATCAPSPMYRLI